MHFNIEKNKIIYKYKNDYNNVNICGRSLFQPYYHILKKAFEEKQPKEVIIRLFENQNEITNLGISPISIVEEMAKEIREKSDVVCNFIDRLKIFPTLEN